MRKKYTIICDDLEILEVFLDYMYRKKFLKNILKKNDKLQPFYGKIVLTINKDRLKNILKKRFNNQLIVR